MTNLQEFKDNLQEECFGKGAMELRANGLCIECGELALENCYSKAGRDEVRISGICEKCFDKMFK